MYSRYIVTYVICSYLHMLHIYLFLLACFTLALPIDPTFVFI